MLVYYKIMIKKEMRTIMTGKIKKVLIVEDDISFKELLVNYIASFDMNIEVRSASNVNGMILEFNKMVPDLIFLDVVLPGISGIELLKFLRAINCKSIVYLMTGFSGVIKNSPVKPDGYLEKPFELDRIGDILRELT